MPKTNYSPGFPLQARDAKMSMIYLHLEDSPCPLHDNYSNKDNRNYDCNYGINSLNRAAFQQ